MCYRVEKVFGFWSKKDRVKDLEVWKKVWDMPQSTPTLTPNPTAQLLVVSENETLVVTRQKSFTYMQKWVPVTVSVPVALRAVAARASSVTHSSAGVWQQGRDKVLGSRWGGACLGFRGAHWHGVHATTCHILWWLNLYPTLGTLNQGPLLGSLVAGPWDGWKY